jgi:hypothetical protein
MIDAKPGGQLAEQEGLYPSICKGSRTLRSTTWLMIVERGVLKVSHEMLLLLRMLFCGWPQMTVLVFIWELQRNVQK